ncbi:fructokinase [Erysipelotrichaceae bacterium]|nr:fructokinase [Erysipelotrichaceae bacterium]
MLYGIIEAGGTKFICGVADENQIIERISIETTTPQKTMPDVIAFFKKFDIVSLAIGCFGPIDIRKNSPTYGYILQTPKIAWQQYNFLGEMQTHFDIPMFWETDVNVAAFGEFVLGAAKDAKSCLYLTIGTGVGGGYCANGAFLPTLLHPEMGHIHLKRLDGDSFEGSCPFHDDCVEGLVSGPAIEKRAGKKAEEIPEDDIIWEMVARYIAQALQTYTMVVSPEKIILGGGVMKREHLYPLVRKYFLEYINGYIDFEALGVTMDTYIIAPQMPDYSATYGCVELAKRLVK